jgi:hypothetical protein
VRKRDGPRAPVADRIAAVAVGQVERLDERVGLGDLLVAEQQPTVRKNVLRQLIPG